MDDVSHAVASVVLERTKCRTIRFATTVRTRATITVSLAGFGPHVSIGFQVAHSASRRDIAT